MSDQKAEPGKIVVPEAVLKAFFGPLSPYLSRDEDKRLECGLAAALEQLRAELLSDEAIGLLSTHKAFEDTHPLTLKEGIKSHLDSVLGGSE